MERWAHKQNIERCMLLLQTETSPSRREVLHRIIEDERRRLACLGREAPKPS